jgi:hypothetical protein
LIKNLSNNKVIAKQYILCKSLFSKFLGLMFSTKKNLIFEFPKEQRISLHMLFVFFPIYAVYLDKSKKVVFTKKLSPFISFCYPKQKAKYILELINKPNLKIGDKISF